MSIITVTLDPPNYKSVGASDIRVYIAHALHSFVRTYERRAKRGESLAFDRSWSIEKSSRDHGATLTIAHAP
jgi:hypothetical protein